MIHSSILLQHIYCLMTDSDRPTRTDVDLLIEGNKVKAIGPTGTIRPVEPCRIIDCSHHVVIPGFVNTHHHFYQTLTRNLPAVQDAELFDWLRYLYNIWKHLDEEAVYVSSMLAMAELLKTGCTCTTDHHYLYPSGFTSDLMGCQFEAADRVGMRFSPTRGSMSLSQKDGGLPPDSVVQTADQILADSERVIHTYHDPDGMAMHKIVLAPCSPFSVTKELMKESAALARRHGVRLHTHLAETRDENQFCIEMYKKRPLALMEECDLIGEDVFYAHGIHFNDDELRLLAESQTHIAHCPSSNMRLGSGICRVSEMLRMGINVGIAVDGSASNDSSDMLQELRTTLLLQRVQQGANAITARQVFKMATHNGAKLLNFSKVGILQEGWAADIAIFDMNHIGYAGAQSDPIASLIFCGYDHQASYTIVNGNIVVDNKRLVGINEESLALIACRSSDRLLAKAR
ncbi:MAG: 8-oxoguanine deaminase [Sphaerochaetaceae bacterium]|nr:8-oxoguanine deaminase [Sphaerochaetaceae bacterium]NLO60665.1 8-oxoguanine deaminase [Spirochaetales bacterium]MDD2405977.1 8-oxoguanine deaminase [Sphaerochaetaceae bacterium]MDD3670605.1 8-oxoguanine deaminase [Sphaerochaetaceae bacterium]MDD4259492.1 8-oxoguanine deaminase [Sphaerochaetaceae bacterium]